MSSRKGSGLSRKQRKLDKNRNGRIDGGDFRMMRKMQKKGTTKKKYRK